MSDSFSIMLNGHIRVSHGFKKFLKMNNHECKIILNKDPEAYDITIRFKTMLNGVEHDIQFNDENKIVVLIRKSKDFFEKIIKEGFKLEDNGDFGAMYLLNVEASDLITPLLNDIQESDEKQTGEF